MPLTDQDIRALVYLAGRCRPHGAPQWDDAGTFSAIAKVRQLHLADVALSVIRAADDANAKTPGVIANTSAPNWQERGTRPRQLEPFDRGTFCAVCQEPEDRCRRIWAADHEYESIHQHTIRVARERIERTAHPAPTGATEKETRP